MRLFQKAPILARAFGRVGLLARFSVLSLVCTAALGIVLARTLGDVIDQRALDDSVRSADLITRFGILPQLSDVDLQNGLSNEAVGALDQALRAGYTSADVRRIVVWNTTGRIVYSPDHSLIGRQPRIDGGLEKALAGHPAVDVSDESDAATAGGLVGRFIEAYVPLRFQAGGRPSGAFEVYLDYGPVAASIARDTHRLYIALGLALLLLWLALFRIVQGASRRLRRQAAENEYQAQHDLLTELPNRGSFYERVRQAIAAAHGDDDRSAVMIVDLDRFKEVNDTLGHYSGDLLLKQAAERLSGTLREGDVLARLGGDEFAVLLPRVRSAELPGEVAARLTHVLESPFTLNDLTVHIEASVGIALFPEHGDDAETLMRRADVAMYGAKASSSTFEVYSANLDQHSPGRLALLGELKHALEEEELELHYQPKASLRSGRVEGVEALVRWRHPERGLVPPLEFIPLAEQTGLIKPITAWVIDRALAQCRAWVDQGYDLTVAVNLSVRNLLDAQLPESVADALRRHELPPSRLELEITEGTIIADQVRALDVITRLHAMGIRLSVDDFGTGYSSLAYLKDLPVGELKIDRKFINNMAEDGDDAFIVRSTIDLGRNLGLQVVAEGVETAVVWDQLARLGCDVAQGYYLSRPLPPADLAAWLRERRDALLPDPGSVAVRSNVNGKLET